MRARKNGNLAAARALLRVLAAEQPGLPQIWLALATVAETRAEQRQALERVAALDPANPLARRGLERMGVELPATEPPAAVPEPDVAPVPPPAVAALDEPAARPADEPGLGSAVALAPVAPLEATRARAIRWPLYVVIAVAVLAVLVAAVLIRGGGAGMVAVAPTPSLPGAESSPALPGADSSPVPAAEATAPLEAAASPAPAPTAAPPTATSRPTATATATPRPSLAVGEVVKEGDWHAVLLRPNDAVVLDGAIGALQPRGRFVLALVAVGNDGAAPARIPADLFALVDQAGTRYQPLPAASTAYLNTYGRGQRGDLSLEDLIPADGGNKSVPLIFDVPPGAGELFLVVKDRLAGWPVQLSRAAGRAPASML
jgi:hypothetical protein